MREAQVEGAWSALPGEEKAQGDLTMYIKN